MNSVHQQYMQRCLELAQLGLGSVAPNPMVGSVIVHNDQIIGEGYHRKYGQAHAEVNAINSVQDKELLKDSTLYVNLEPCSHYGKTPPCADLIVRMGIPRVVIGTIDTNDKVCGKGVEKLKQAGIEVTVGVLEEECHHLNRAFFTYHNQQRPYIILKWAQTRDLFIDRERAANPTRNWISNRGTTQLAHKWRTEIDVLLVGYNTALNDNPQLNARLWAGKSPVRAVIDPNLALPHSLHLFDGQQPTLVFNLNKNGDESNISYIKIKEGNVAEQVAREIYNRQLQTLMVEGGAKTLDIFLSANLWDEARVITGDKFFGTGIAAPRIAKEPSEVADLLGDKVSVYYR